MAQKGDLAVDISHLKNEIFQSSFYGDSVVLFFWKEIDNSRRTPREGETLFNGGPASRLLTVLIQKHTPYIYMITLR
ncbi:MAG: hypothetical protein Q7S62_00445 [bacterium]|nr:hypothetical protein [bacterium]